MTTFCENVFLGEETSNHERSILLVDIMNAMGFSKCEREIRSHEAHLRNLHMNIFQTTYKQTATIAGSTSDGMCGGLNSNNSHHDIDILCTIRDIKLCTRNENNISKTLIYDNEDYVASFFVEEDDNFPGYVKLSLAEVKTNWDLLAHSTENTILGILKRLIKCIAFITTCGPIRHTRL